MSSVNVSNISSSTSADDVKAFLSFCGKISSLTLNDAADGTKSATVVFEKESASKTALLLDRTSLGSNEIHVSASKDASTASTESTIHHDDGSDELRQEDKPRTRILAEVLASGYKLGDQVLQKGIEIDNQHGISSKFTRALQDFDKKTGASTRAEAVDKQYDITTKVTQSAHSAWSGLSSYYEKFSGTAPGLRLHQFYQQGNKQVQDIHQEALRLSGLKKQESASGHTSQTVGAVEQGLKKAEDTLSSAKSTELGPQSVTGNTDHTTGKTGTSTLTGP